jgi:hypothetical protein
MFLDKTRHLRYLTNKRFFKKTRVSYQMLQVHYKIFWNIKFRKFLKGKVSCQFKFYLKRISCIKKFKRAFLLTSIITSSRFSDNNLQNTRKNNYLSLSQRKSFFLLGLRFFIINKHAVI